MEMINGDGVLHGTYHWSTTDCGKDSSNGNQTQMPRDWAVAFHEYAVEYSPDHITFVVDGKPYHTIDHTQAQLYDVPWYIILNTACGGPWPRPIDSRTVLPTYHIIDYVRVSQKKNSTKPQYVTSPSE